MALFDTLRRLVVTRRGDGYGPTSPAWQGAAVATPGSVPGSLGRIILADIYGPELAIPTREEAMKVSSIAKGRALVAGTLSRYPLVAYRRDARLPAQPSWLSRTDTGQPPAWRMLWTIDDLIFHGRSLWTVRRGPSRSSGPGPILDAVRVPFDEWELTEDLFVEVQGSRVDADEVIYFDGPQDALLDIASEDIQAARNMTRSWANRVKSPVPLVELHNTADVELTDDEISELTTSWDRARQNGGTAYTPNNVEVNVHGETPTDLYVQGRNSSRIDFANYLNLPAGILDGSPSTASLTYSTREGQRSELVDLCLSYWTLPIAARLSMDDATPRGTRVDFDISWLATPTQPNTANPPSED